MLEGHRSSLVMLLLLLASMGAPLGLVETVAAEPSSSDEALEAEYGE